MRQTLKVVKKMMWQYLITDQVDVPKSSILLGCKGSSDSGTIATLGRYLVNITLFSGHIVQDFSKTKLL